MERFSTTLRDPRVRVRGTYFLVLALGVLFSVLILAYSQQVLDVSQRLVRSELPLLDRITSLKVEISRQEAALHDYYAAGDRERLERTFVASGETSRQLLDEIAADYGEAEPIPSVRALIARFESVARGLQPEFVIAPDTSDETRAQLARVSELGRELHAELDVLAGLVETRAFSSARTTQETVRNMAQLAILFSMAVFLIAVFAGYHVNTYLRSTVERRRLAVFAERNPNPVMRLALDGEVIYANTAAVLLARRMGADSVKVLLPTDFRDRLAALRGDAERYQVWQYEREARSLECGVHFLPDLETFHAYVADVTERRLNEEKLVYQAYHHPLTGLPNRRMFQEVVQKTLWAPEHGGAQAAVLVIGVDRFKVVSETLGHAAGDELLQAIAARLGAVIEDFRASHSHNAMLYHLEGDTFAVFEPGLTGNPGPALIAEKLLSSSAQPLYVGGREFFIGFSVGVAVFPGDGRDAAELLKNAASAMQRVRAQGGGFRLYKPEMNAMAAHWLALENYLRHAIERNELRLYYQPQVDARSGRLVSLEALLRWDHPQRGILTPRDFIRLAEDSGMIVPIGDWVLRSACAQNRAWRDRGVIRTVVAVNISARQFHRQNLPALIGAVLAETRLPAEALELEITESVAMEDVARTADMLHELKEMGVRLAIDDFGTGFSSLAYLKRFPLDKLKIDQSFVHHITSDDTDAAIVRGIVTLGHALELDVVAEGVETAEQLARLREYGCDEVQGMFHGEPLPAHGLEAFLRNQRLGTSVRA